MYKKFNEIWVCGRFEYLFFHSSLCAETKLPRTMLQNIIFPNEFVAEVIEQVDYDRSGTRGEAHTKAVTQHAIQEYTESEEYRKVLDKYETISEECRQQRSLCVCFFVSDPEGLEPRWYACVPLLFGITSRVFDCD